MDAPKNDRQNRIILLGILCVIAILALVSYIHNTAPVAPVPIATSTVATTTTANSITAIFDCNNKKTVTAIFTTNHVELDLSDGRHVSLAQSISADGGRYATSNDSFVFWNKGNTAFITENGTTTFDGCVTQ